MKAWSIFMHSVRQVFGNFQTALSISSPLLALMALSLFVFWDTLLMDVNQLRAAVQSGAVVISPARMIMLAVAQFLISLWIAVAWHRFVLLDEDRGLLPPFHGGRMAAYFGKSLLISLVLVLPCIITSMLMFGAINALTKGIAPMNPGILLLIAPLFIPVCVIFLRLFIILPGTALGEPTSIGQAWRLTRGETKTFLLLVLILFAFGLIEAGLRLWLIERSSVISIVWQIAVSWLSTMLGLSLLTTLYGHYVQRRPLT